jgi:hypothetical protein
MALADVAEAYNGKADGRSGKAHITGETCPLVKR